MDLLIKREGKQAEQKEGTQGKEEERERGDTGNNAEKLYSYVLCMYKHVTMNYTNMNNYNVLL